MALITRLSRLFRADLHAVLDAIEAPEVLLRQAVREMEEAFATDVRQLDLLGHEQTQLSRRQTACARRVSQLEEELEICFVSQKDDLARAVLKRKLETQRLQQLLAHRMEALHASATASSTAIEENRTRLERMRQRMEVLFAQDHAGAVDEGVPRTDLLDEITVRDEEVEVAFLREPQRRSRS